MKRCQCGFISGSEVCDAEAAPEDMVRAWSVPPDLQATAEAAGSARGLEYRVLLAPECAAVIDGGEWFRFEEVAS